MMLQNALRTSVPSLIYVRTTLPDGPGERSTSPHLPLFLSLTVHLLFIPPQM